ncbi:hypothetical protein [Sorangium sp. So ce388]|uniref:hypothetical protein n=1 Tax=Sorangium sp. So ce388 TaxID=3133309 RepID=UPI003F5B3D13
MATKTKKMTGKDISTDDVLTAIGGGLKFAHLMTALGLPRNADRALDSALQREKRAGRIRFERGLWVRTSAQATLAKPKRGGRAA